MKILDIGEHIRMALSEVHQEVSRFSYPLFAIDSSDRPDQYSSCVLFECDGVPVLVTAAHAISEIAKTGSAVHIGAKRITELPGQFILSSRSGHDPLDIAALALPRDFLKAEEMDVLPIDRTTFEKQFQAFHFRCIHGYPCTKNKQNKRADVVNKVFTKYGFTYVGASRETQVDYGKFKKDANLHVALQYDSSSINDKGDKVTPPHPKGISGGGLWLIPDSFVPTTNYLEGIAIEYHKSNSLVFATRIDHVISFVQQFVLR